MFASAVFVLKRQNDLRLVGLCAVASHSEEMNRVVANLKFKRQGVAKGAPIVRVSHLFADGQEQCSTHDQNPRVVRIERSLIGNRVPQAKRDNGLNSKAKRALSLFRRTERCWPVPDTTA